MLFLAVFLAALVLVSFSTPSHAEDVAKCVCIGPPHAIGEYRCMNHFAFLHQIDLRIDQDPRGLRGYIGEQPFEAFMMFVYSCDKAARSRCDRRSLSRSPHSQTTTTRQSWLVRAC
jgi:hypothetical protein